MLLTPLAFAVVFEVGRLDVSGPTVDGIHTSFHGLITLITGRGFHAVLSLLWMALGAFVGTALAQEIAAGPGARATRSLVGPHARRAATVLVAIAFAGAFAIVAQPASTDPIVDEDGNEVSGSVAERTTVEVNGHDLALMIRGHGVENPVLLFLAIGPGGSDMGSMRNHLPELEQHFTVATWDQRVRASHIRRWIRSTRSPLTATSTTRSWSPRSARPGSDLPAGPVVEYDPRCLGRPAAP